MGCARGALAGLVAAMVVGGSFGGMSAARADSIAVWDFDAFTLDATGGTQAGSATLGFTGTPTYGGGTTVNDANNEVPNFSLSAVGTQNNGKILTFAFSMTSYQSLVMTYATDRTGAGLAQTWKYSTDGIGYTMVSPPIAPGTDFGLATVDLSGVAALNNAPKVYLEMLLSGAKSSNDEDQFDNFVISAASTVTTNGGVATPLPAGASLGGMGLLGLGMWSVRRRRGEC